MILSAIEVKILAYDIVIVVNNVSNYPANNYLKIQQIFALLRSTNVPS